MVSSRQKGRKSELLAKKKLEAEGWNVCLTDMPTKFKKSQDFFGCWDIIAIKKQPRMDIIQHLSGNSPDKYVQSTQTEIKLIQIKTNSWGDLRECKAFKNEYFYNEESVTCEVWQWQSKKKEWKVRIL